MPVNDDPLHRAGQRTRRQLLASYQPQSSKLIKHAYWTEQIVTQSHR